MDFLKDFGVKPVLLIAQIVNFLILLFILKRFLYKPILKVLEERRRKIAEGLKNAEEIEQRLTKLEVDQKKQLQKAAAEAKDIIDEAGKNADKIIAEAHLKAGRDIDKLIGQSQAHMRLEREKLYQQIRAEVADLVATSLRKVTGKVVTEKDKKELIEKSLKDIYESR